MRRSPGRAASSDGTFRIMGRTKSDGEVPLPPPPGMPSTSRGSHKRLLPSPGSGAHHRRGALDRRLVRHAIESWEELHPGLTAFRDRLERLGTLDQLAAWWSDRCCDGCLDVTRRDQARARPRLAYLACPVQATRTASTASTVSPRACRCRSSSSAPASSAQCARSLIRPGTLSRSRPGTLSPSSLACTPLAHTHTSFTPIALFAPVKISPAPPPYACSRHRNLPRQMLLLDISFS